MVSSLKLLVAETYIELVKSSHALCLVPLPPVACSMWAHQVTVRLQLILILQSVTAQLAFCILSTN